MTSNISPIIIETDGGTEVMRVDPSGNVGIGTTTPRNPLGIRGTGAAQELLSFEDPTGNTKWHVNQDLGGNSGLNVAETGVADGRLFIEAGGHVGVNTTTPANPLDVNGNEGIRQNRLYMSGGDGWSSLTYNAHHNDANDNWVFPDQSRTSVTIEMDDNNGIPRFQVWSTTPGNPTGWIERFAIDGNTGNTWVGGDLSFAGNLFGKHGDATQAHWAWLFAYNSIEAFDISLAFPQQLFAFIALTSINHLQVLSPGTGNFAYITAVDGGDPFGGLDPSHSVWSGTAQRITFRLQSTIDSQAWALAVVFPQQG